ncbi:MAG TPA: mdtC domain protein [Bdellovibrionales bacterium]|nr:mdtC domain protein [Bdellovibrionales bacterium]
MYKSHDVLIIKLTAKFLCNLLSKLRSPQKHDAPDKALNALLDLYLRTYVNGSVSRKGRH